MANAETVAELIEYIEYLEDDRDSEARWAVQYKEERDKLMALLAKSLD